VIAATRPLRCNTGASRGFRTFALFVDLLKAAQKVGFHFVKALLCDVTACNGFPLYFTKPGQVTALYRRQRVWCVFCHGYSAKSLSTLPTPKRRPPGSDSST
jgi:hypothetical protein